jgi:hypothetical protein
MKSGFQDIVRTVVNQYGLGILDDKGKCNSLLEDFAKGKYKPEIRLFMLAIEANFHTKLAQSSTPEITAGMLIQTLQDSYFIDAQAARDTVVFLGILLNKLKPSANQPEPEPQSTTPQSVSPPVPQADDVIPAGFEWESDGAGVKITRYIGQDVSVVIPNTVKTIGGQAFSGCTGLTSIIIPNSVQSIGRDAFSGCTSLQEVILSRRLKVASGTFPATARIRFID